MTERFEDTIVAGVTGHMNGDHGSDNLDIVRAFGGPETVQASSATMTDLDTEVGVWAAVVGDETVEVRVPWPGAPLSERPQLRTAVVVLHEAAREKLGLPAAEKH